MARADFTTQDHSNDNTRRAQGAGLWLATLLLAVAGAFVTPAAKADAGDALRPFSNSKSDQPPPPWHFTTLPNKPDTRFEVVQQGRQRVLKVESDQSYGNLVHRTLVPLQGEPTLAWRWRVDQFVQGADLRTKAGDDGAAKLCVFFDLPVDRLSFTERARLAIARSLTGEDVPSEVLCYVWDNKEPRGALLTNAYTDRMQMMVLESGATAVPGGWLQERRNLLADYRRAFGHEAGSTVPDVSAVAVSADADNTHGHGLAYFTDIDLRSALPAQNAAAASPSPSPMSPMSLLPAASAEPAPASASSP
ncbi:MAG: DUF3047 domain-containing protein [Variovorax sp.]